MKLQLINSISLQQTIQIMDSLVDQHKTDTTIRQYVANMVRTRRLRDGDVQGLCDAVYAWVRQRVKYWADISDVETIQSPHVTLQLGIGDCDDLSVLAATMLQAAGVQTRWLLLGYNGDYPEHICVCCYKPDSSMVAVDCSEEPCGLLGVVEGATFSAVM